MRVRTSLSVALGVALTVNAPSLAKAADDHCGVEFVKALFENFKQEQRTQSFSARDKLLFDTYQKYRQHKKEVGGTFEIPAQLKIGGNYDEADLEREGKVRFDQDTSQEAIDAYLRVDHSSMAQAAHSIYQECAKLNDARIDVKTDYLSGPTGTTNVTVTFYYRAGPGTPAAQKVKAITLVNLTPKEDSSLWKAWQAKPATTRELPLGNETWTLVASREVRAQTPEMKAGTVLAPEGQVIIQTTPGSIVRSLPAIVVPPPPPPTVDPVGSVVAYAGLLDVAHPAPTNWLPCDGRSLLAVDFPQLFAAIGTTYNTADKNQSVTFNLPDYRGYFLRGLDTTVSSEVARDEGRPTRVLGSIQKDAVGQHQHDLPVAGKEGSSSLPSNPSPHGYNNGNLTDTGVGLGVETRPKNVAVYWLIRVQ